MSQPAASVPGSVAEVRAVLGRAGATPGPVEVAAALRGLGALVSEGTVRDTVAALRRRGIQAFQTDQRKGSGYLKRHWLNTFSF